MRPAKKIKSLFAKSNVTVSSEVDNKLIRDAFLAFEKSKKKSAAIQPNIWRIIMKSKITKLAAAAVIIFAVVIGVHHFGGSIGVATPAFAEVLEQIYYKETFHPGEESEFTTEEMIIESGLMRSVMPHGDIMIWDFAGGRDLHLMPNNKRAILTQRVGRKRGKRLFNYLEWVSKLHEESGEFAGRQEVGGQMADMFVVQAPFEKTIVWVNPETNLPVRVEMTQFPNPDNNIIMPKMSLNLGDFGGEGYFARTISISSGRGSGKGVQEKMTTVMSDFVWNADLDESLFSLEPPEGYTVEEKQFDVSDRGENGLIYALAFWTEMSEGLFPSAINDLGDPNKVRPMLVEKFDRDGDPEEELEQAVQVMHEILKGLMFAQQRKVDGSWHYAGDGVRLGDADKPICWWKPEDSNGYRVIYGNLSIGDATADDLPEMPELQKYE
jgi:hypothetical protein